MNSRTAPFEALTQRAFPQRAFPMPRLPDADAIDVRALMRTLWKARVRILAAAALCGMLALMLVSLVTPTYTAASKIMLDPRKAQIITNNQLVADLDASEQVVNGELAVLRSNLLLEQVIRTTDPAVLDLIDPALRPKSLIARMKAGVSELLKRNDEAAPPPDAETLAAWRMERLVGTVRRMLTIYNEPSSFVMVIRVQSENPRAAQVLADGMAETYIGLQLDARQQAVGQATEWLEERLAVLRAEVEAAEAAVAQFQAESLIMDGGTLDNATQQLANLTGQLIEARAARVEAEARLEQLSAVVGRQGMSAASQIVDTPALQSLRVQALVFSV